MNFGKMNMTKEKSEIPTGETESSCKERFSSYYERMANDETLPMADRERYRKMAEGQVFE